jgi:hypothetical protein
MLITRYQNERYQNEQTQGMPAGEARTLGSPMPGSAVRVWAEAPGCGAHLTKH